MDDTGDPAKESQPIHSGGFGCEPDQVLTGGKAARLIGSLRQGEENYHASAEHCAPQTKENVAHHLQSSDKLAGQTVADSRDDLPRQEFWMDTCREPLHMQIHTGRIMEFYMKYGCRYNVPNHEQAQEILEALDVALPLWEQTHPELFYQTLELNFPQLRRFV